MSMSKNNYDQNYDSFSQDNQQKQFAPRPTRFSTQLDQKKQEERMIIEAHIQNIKDNYKKKFDLLQQEYTFQYESLKQQQQSEMQKEIYEYEKKIQSHIDYFRSIKNDSLQTKMSQMANLNDFFKTRSITENSQGKANKNSSYTNTISSKAEKENQQNFINRQLQDYSSNKMERQRSFIKTQNYSKPTINDSYNKSPLSQNLNQSGLKIEYNSTVSSNPFNGSYKMNTMNNNYKQELKNTKNYFYQQCEKDNTSLSNQSLYSDDDSDDQLETNRLKKFKIQPVLNVSQNLKNSRKISLSFNSKCDTKY